MRLILLFCFITSIAFSQSEESYFHALSPHPYFSSIEEAIKQKDEVYNLDLRKQNLKQFPEEILSFKNLQILFLDSNQIKKIPEEINQLSKLKVLGLGHNQIKKVPFQVGRLYDLRLLYLNSNHIQELPVEIFDLEKLEGLYLEKNELTVIPKEIEKLKQLKLLWYTDNKIEVLPKELGQLKFLKSFAATNNLIKRIPDELFNATELEKLFLSQNQISKIPENIYQLKKLNTLLLDFNAIKELPTSIGSLQQLKTMYLSDNLITEIPNQIGNLKQIDFLALSNNKLKTLPNEIGNLQKLKTLALRNNPLDSIPTSIIHCSQLTELFLNGVIFKNYPSFIYDLELKNVKVVGLICAVEYKEISEEIRKIDGNYYYPKLLRYYLALDYPLTTSEYRYLYYGYVFHKNYQPLEPSKDETQFFEYIKTDKVADAIKLGYTLLENEPANLDVVANLSNLLLISGNPSKCNVLKQHYFGLLSAIESSGDGLQNENAFHLIFPKDQYQILFSRGLEKTKSDLETLTEKVIVKTPNSYNIEALYFDISYPISFGVK